MKTILVTNDDGFESEGLKVLVDSLKDLARVIVVAPSSEKSACSHSLTLSHPLRFIKLDDDFYKLDDGTPSDCIYLSLNIFAWQMKNLEKTLEKRKQLALYF